MILYIQLERYPRTAFADRPLSIGVGGHRSSDYYSLGNGNVESAGQKYLWIGKRSEGKQTYPGMLDHLVAELYQLVLSPTWTLMGTDTREKFYFVTIESFLKVLFLKFKVY
ncbi:hypothetical protein Vadar_020828 [Vaccinium darrowii]|uniref:Uncharacterized protein n=1 Tax=Vaccinium darrowii TaxID=229202 RepID=A0ACB7YNY5_9ERIC|nr:hypothetical protein Vadar_020828 [Vaccinium darrowii]